jgi:RimJ/RimL family protein N-acetyltransferase
MNGDEVASIAFSSCMFIGQLEIGVETVEKFRGMGYAKQVCQELISFCIENSYTPIWACRKENVGSFNLAKSLGFEEELVLPYYELVSN